FRDRAVFGFREGFGEGFERGFGRGFVNGRAIPRGWNFARTTDLSARNLAQRRVTPTVAQVSAMRTVNSPLQQPTRNFADVHQVRTTQPGAIARTRPTIGDSVPALKRDWKLPTVPRPGVPTPVAPPFASKGHSSEARAFGTSPGGHPTDTRSGQSVRPMPGGAVPPHATATPPTGHPTDTRARGTASGVPQGGHPTDFRGARPGQDFPLSAQRGAGSNPSHPTDRRSGVSSQPSGRSFRDTNPYTNSPRVPQSRYSDRSGPGNGSPWSSPRANPYTNTPRAPEPRYSDRSRSGDGGRSVLRPFFQPLNQPHPQPHIQSAPSAPRTQAPSHPAPSHPAPSHSTPSQPQSGGHRDHGHP
ncbi:MAG TPA: hypothetical protein VN083_01470, partial [Vicinamibacteria bacterium]|nr:hypothetical protein [Vicinamibacteria bacterium]